MERLLTAIMIGRYFILTRTTRETALMSDFQGYRRTTEAFQGLDKCVDSAGVQEWLLQLLSRYFVIRLEEMILSSNRRRIFGWARIIS